MGEVYAARDVQLGRRVALKILPQSRAADRDRVERFLREARAASSLNHPAIVTIFDSGTEGDVHYLAMELIEGETLTQWTRGGRNREKLPAILTQVAEGLARAHAGGIIHRDLKPDNVMVARGGQAKIVDFGIAKLTERDAVGGAAGDTAPTSILGTTSFMSPEQIEGRAVDHRSDIFSFGCLVYAAYQGRSPFERESPVKTMNAIVSDAPPPLVEAPREIERIARRCLAKDPDERYQSMKDIALDLREPVELAAARRPQRSGALFVAFAVAVILAAAAWMAGHPRSDEETKPKPREMAPQMTMMRLTYTGKIVNGSVSPDGKYIVYATAEGNDETLWVKQIATGTDVRIVPPANGLYNDIKVSPDGNYVFYSFAMRENANVVDVYRVPILGGDARKIASNIDSGMNIAPDGRRIAFRRFNAVTRETKLFVADIDGATERTLITKMPPEDFGTPSWSPDGRNLTFIFGADGKIRPNIVNFDLETNRMTKIPSPPWPGLGGITWIPDGSGIVLTAAEPQQRAQLWYLPVNDGPARKITNDIAFYGGVSFTSDSKAFVTNRQEDSANLWLVDVASGRARALTSGLGTYTGSNGVQWLPDGNILYTDSAVNALRMAWRVLDPRTGLSRELPLQHLGWNPAVSPDQAKIAFFASENNRRSLWVADIHGENARPVTDEPIAATSLSWMPDSRTIVYITSGAAQAAWRIDTETKLRERLTDGPANTPAVAPDGNLLLCRLRSTEEGKPLWRTALLQMQQKTAPRYLPIPRGGGPHVFEWLPDGKSFAFLDFVNGVTNVWIQDLAGGPPRQVTRFDSGRVVAYDLSRDGKSLVVSHSEQVNDLVMIRDFR
jgi:Tol biopolymer transport system component